MPARNRNEREEEMAKDKTFERLGYKKKKQLPVKGVLHEQKRKENSALTSNVSRKTFAYFF